MDHGVVFILIAPENGSTAALLFGVVFNDGDRRGTLETVGMLMGTVRVVGDTFRRHSDGYAYINWNKVPMMHRVENWQNRIKGFFEDKEAVPAK